MRYFLGALALSFALAGIGTAASASEPSTVAATQAATTTKATQSANDPDVVEWTAHLVQVRKAEAAKPHGLAAFAGNMFGGLSKFAVNVTHSALRFLGVPYVFGGTSTSGFDCSGYVQHVFAMLGIHLPRTADAQFYAGKPAVGGPRPGDLVFFQTYLPGPSHVGIYLGNGEFAHASSHGVMVSKLSQSYWASRYLGARRYVASNQ